jgi:hypothetical protein
VLDREVLAEFLKNSRVPRTDDIERVDPNRKQRDMNQNSRKDKKKPVTKMKQSA